MWTLLLIAAAQSPAAAAWPRVVVASPDGRHEAVIEKVAEHAKLRDAFARWDLSVVRVEGNSRAPLWSCRYPYQGRGRFALADGGLVFAAAFEPYQPGQPLLRLHREGAEFASVRGSELELARAGQRAAEGGAQWIDSAPDALRFAWRTDERGPQFLFNVRGLDGREHALDAARGVLDLLLGEPELTVDPLPAVEQGTPLELPYVTALRGPTHARADQPIELSVDGSFPTPNWYIAGYGLEQDEQDPFLLTLRPLAAPPKASIQAAVLQGFRGSPELSGLAPGRWTIRVVGREAQPLEPLVIDVLPAGLVARWQRGERVREWYAHGVLGDAAAGKWRLLGGAEQQALERRRAELPQLPRPSAVRATGVADASAAAVASEVALGWWSDAGWREWRGAAERLPEWAGALVAALERD